MNTNGVALIGKADEWVYRFSFREAAFRKNEMIKLHRFPQISCGAWDAALRCPILRMNKAVIMSILIAIIHKFIFKCTVLL